MPRTSTIWLWCSLEFGISVTRTKDDVDTFERACEGVRVRGLRRKSMLLVIDIGNTNVVLGLFEGAVLKHSWRVATRRDRTADEWAVLFLSLFSLHGLEAKRLEGVLICSVVPPLNECFAELAKQFFQVSPRFVEPEKQTLMPVLYHPVEDVGADRIVNAIAAVEMFGAPSVIVDFGTATTFDVVSEKGAYLGGVIAPGIGISAEALFARAAKLPRIEIRKPNHPIGRSTVESMQSGIFYGYAGLVDGILSRLRKELGNPTVIATGGYARLISSDYDGFDAIEDDLTMHGLRIIHERMR